MKTKQGMFIIVLFFVLVLGAFVFLKDFTRQDLNLTQVSTTKEVMDFTDPEKPWMLTTIDREVLAPQDFTQHTLLYATKQDRHVTVMTRDIQKGTDKIVFEYQEVLSAAGSGNYWKALPPNIALAPDLKKFAFIDEGGLKIYNINTKQTQTLIKKLRTPTVEESESNPTSGVIWSLPEIVKTFDLFSPFWSADGEYVFFTQALFEGADLGAVDVTTGKYVSTGLAAGESSVVASPLGHSLIKPTCGYYEGTGLYLFSQSDPENPSVDLAQDFDKEEACFLAAAFSQDAKKLAVTFHEKLDELTQAAENNLGMLKIDEGDWLVVHEGGFHQTPFFTPDGRSLLFFLGQNGRTTMRAYHLDSSKMSVLVDLPQTISVWQQPAWLGDGLIFLVGIQRDATQPTAETATLSVVFDLTRQKIVYTSLFSKSFVTIAGFLD